MDLRALQYFVRIAEMRSISKAARSLHVAQPSLTRQLHKLESEVRSTLFVRLNRGVALTEAGELLHEHASRLFHDVERMQAAMLAHGTQPAGPVRLGLPPTLGPVVLPELIARLRKSYPKVVLDVVPSRNLTLADWLLTGRVDVAILAQSPDMPEIRTAPIAEEEMVLLTGPGLRKPGAVTAAELAATPVVGTESLLAITSDLLRSQGVKLRVELALNNLDAVREMVRKSMCTTIFPYAFIREDHLRGLFDAHRITQLGIRRRLDIGVSRDRPQTSAMEVVVKSTEGIINELTQQRRLALAEVQTSASYPR